MINYNRKIEALERLAARPGTAAEGVAARSAIDRLKAEHYALQPIGSAPIGSDLYGLRIRLDRTCDRTHPCCDDAGVGVVVVGAGPHSHGLRCEGCDRHRGWLKRRAIEKLRILHADGLLGPLVPTLRDDVILRGAMPRHPDGAGHSSAVR